MNGGRLLLQARQLPLEIVDEHVGHVVREPTPDDHAQGGEVGPMLRERVRRNLPAALTHCVRDIENRVVLDLVLQRESEDRQLVSSRQELEGAHLGDLRREARGDVAGVRLDAAVALEAESEEVVVLRDDLRAGSREVQREGRHVVAEVVDPEDQVLR